MSYRGIENIIGNGDEFLDGCLVSASSLYYTNNRADYSDNSTAQMQLLFSSLITGSGYIRYIQKANSFPSQSYGFIATDQFGTSNTHYCDYNYGVPTGNYYMPVVSGYAMPQEGSSRNGVFAQRYNRLASFRDRTTTTRIAH